MEGPWLRVCAGEGGGGGGGAGGVFRGSRRGTVTGVLHGMPHMAGACLSVKCARETPPESASCDNSILQSRRVLHAFPREG